MKDNVILSMRNMKKTYPGVVALDNVSIDFKEGEVHALVGENGAGKSTLVKILSGAVVADQGEFTLCGKEYNKITPKESREQGVELIYQELNLVNALSVAENVFLGNFEGNGVTVDFKAMKRKTADLFNQLGVDINPGATVSDLPVAKMQLVEIAKSLVNDSKILIMDEPTAPLSVNEIEILFKLIQRLKERKVTIIYISHRLSEVFEISDRLTVMRDGQIVKTMNTKDTNRPELIKLMVGRELSETFPTCEKVIGDKILEIKGFKNSKISDVSLDVKKGEVLGLAGLMGAGRTELARMVFGADARDKGDIFIDGEKVKISNPGHAVSYGIGFVPEDRKREGVLIRLSVKENMTLSILRKISKLAVVNRQKEKQAMDKYKDRFRIKTPSYDQKVNNLSGGNQQKVALSKWLANECRILILDEPTRGIDVGAKQEIYQFINQLAQEGLAVILISSDMEEMLGMADRILVLHEGTVSGVVERDVDFTQETILDLASGK